MGPLAPPRTRWIYDCYDWRAKDHLDLPPGDSQAKEWEHSVYKYIYIYTFICVYSKKIESKYTIYNNMCVYIYTRNAWALPRRCSVEGPHSQSNVVATLHSIGKINKGIREY